MRLRRGMVRESCDFCHRRKIKCDRLTRNDLGHTSCSQCSLRNVPCRMEDSDDIRLRGRCRSGEVPVAVPSVPSVPGVAAKRERESFGSEDADKADARQLQLQSQPQSQPPLPQQAQLPPPPARGLSISSASTAASASAPIATHINTHPHSARSAPPPQPSHPLTAPSLGLDVHLLAPSHANIPSHPSHPSHQHPSQHSLPHHHSQHQQHQQQQQQQQQLYTPSPSTATSISVYGNPASSLTDDLFMEDPFQLNADSIFFLDKIFMGAPEAAEWPNHAASSGLLPVGYQQPLVLAQPQDFVQQQQHIQEYQQQQHQLQQQQQQQQYQQYQALSQPAQTQQQTQQQTQPLPQQRDAPDGGYDPAPWVRCSIPQDIFIAALHAYFEYTTIYMPVLLEDAFWQDYHAGRCSLSIIYALVCRGLPFTAGIERNEDKWAMQQRVGTQFRETFFETQLAANNNRGRIRLDDLEALALMVQFKYHKNQSGRDDAPSSTAPGTGTGAAGQQASPKSSASSPAAAALSQLHAHLAGLYLTHDSLVLMTMQSGINGSGGAGSGGIGVGGNNTPSSSATETDDATAPLARINDRRILLFWHVFGLDGFQCLDKKTLSRIPDFNIDTVRSLPRENKGSHGTAATSASGSARGYLDAVLDLSIIARKALTTLSNATARRRGVRAEDALHIYHLLDTWLHTECPPHLRHQRDASGRLCLTGDGSGCGSGSGSGTNTPGNGPYVQLHRAVVWLLAINCYMQIEDCVSEHGIYQPKDESSPHAAHKGTLDTEILYLRIMSETVRHLRDGVDIARSIKTPRWDGSPSSKREYSLADLGTSVVRDCCQGMGIWACARGISWLKRPLPRVLQTQSVRQQQQQTLSHHHQQQGHQQQVSPEEQKRREDADRRKHAETYLESATILRAAVATASSHADTILSLRKLDDLVAELIKGIQKIGS